MFILNQLREKVFFEHGLKNKLRISNQTAKPSFEFLSTTLTYTQYRSTLYEHSKSSIFNLEQSHLLKKKQFSSESTLVRRKRCSVPKKMDLFYNYLTNEDGRQCVLIGNSTYIQVHNNQN